MASAAPYKSFIFVIPSGLQATRNLLSWLFHQPVSQSDGDGDALPALDPRIAACASDLGKVALR